MSFSPTRLKGAMTALVTPFNQDTSIDFGALDAIVDQQIDAGIAALVPCGTTGEAATMTVSERDQVIAQVAKRASGKCVVMAGTGSSCTRDTIDNQRRAKDLGADCGLVVTPSYNKPMPDGLQKHYMALVEAVDLPVLVYNVPSRTGCDIKPEVMRRFSDVSAIVGIKEATGELARVNTLRDIRRDWAILSGDDPSCAAFMLMGGDGVISVASNVLPRDMVTLCEAALRGDAATARGRNRTLIPLYNALALETNPIAVKAAMALQGRLKEIYRLPLSPLAPGNRKIVEQTLSEHHWL